MISPIRQLLRAGASVCLIACAVAPALLCAPAARASYVSFAFTNAFTATPLTNSFLVQKVGDTLADGSAIPAGLPIRITPAADGRATNWLATGNYYVTNSYGAPPFNRINFRAPDDSSATVYFFLSAGVWISGGSFFVTLSGGTNAAPNFSQITNSLGFLPLTAGQNTNLLSSAIPTNFWSPVASTWLSNIAFLTTNGLAHTNYVNAATNGVQTNLTALINTASNAVSGKITAATNALGGAAFKRTNDFIASNNGRGTNASFYGTLAMPDGGPITLGSVVSIDSETATFGPQITLDENSGQVTADQFIGDFVGTAGGLTGLNAGALGGTIPIGTIPSLPGSILTNAVSNATNAQSSLTSSNLVNGRSITNIPVIASPFVQATNFTFASLTNLFLDTNLIAIVRAGTASVTNGVYVWDGARFTNAWNGGTYSNNQSGSLLLRDVSGSTLYSFATVTGTSTVVNGASPFAIAAYGFRFIHNGIFDDGIVTDTNTLARIASAVGTASNALQNAISAKQIALNQVGTSNATHLPVLVGTNLYQLEAGSNVVLYTTTTSIVLNATPAAGGGSSGIATANGLGTNTTLYSPLISTGTLSVATLNNPSAINFLNLSSGTNNSIQTHASSSNNVILGGFGNSMSGAGSGFELYGNVIAGGFFNTMSQNVELSTIAGGQSNSMTGALELSGSFIAGQVNGIYGGGVSPLAASTGNEDFGTDVILGQYNVISNAPSSVALGTGSRITHSGTFMWGDGRNVTNSSAASNTFLVFAENGAGFGTNNPGTNQINAVGNINSTVGFTVNGTSVITIPTNGFSSIVFSNGSTFVATGDTRGLRLTNTANLLGGTFNGAGTISNANNSASALTASNVVSGAVLTNTPIVASPFIQGTNFTLGSLSNLVQSTNLIAMLNAGTSLATNGVYKWTGILFSNSYNAYTYSNNQAGAFLLRDNAGTTLYSFAAITGSSTIVGGASPAALAVYGVRFQHNGIEDDGILTASNLTVTVTNLAIVKPTNAPSDNLIPIATGNQTKWTTASNVFAGGGFLTTNAAGIKFTPFNTNSIYVAEAQPVTGREPAAASTLSVLGTFNYDSDLFWTNANGSGAYIEFTNNGVWHWALVDEVGGIDFTLTNTSPIGTFYPTTAWAADYGMSLNTRLTSTLMVAPTALQAKSSYFASRIDLPKRGGLKGGLPVIVDLVGPTVSLGESALTNEMGFLVANKLQGHVDILHQDTWTGTRSPTLNFSTALFPSWTVASYANYIKTNGFRPGIHVDAGVFDPLSNNVRNGSQGYYRLDATNLIANGIEYLLMDTTVGFSDAEFSAEDSVTSFLSEIRRASGEYRRPVHVMGAFAGRWQLSFSNWMSYADSWVVGPGDFLTVNDAMYLLDVSAEYIGDGAYPMFGMLNTALATSNGCRQVCALAAIGPMSIQLQTNFFTTDVLPIFTNAEWRAVWQDAAGISGWRVSSNLSYRVYTRALGGGDTAVAIINTSNGVSTATVNWTDLGIGTNVLVSCRELFDRTNTTSSSGLSVPVRASDASLWRLSPVKPVITANALATTRSNLLAPASISLTGSPFNWTNTTGVNVFVIADGGTAFSIALNGTTIMSGLAAGLTVPLQPSEYVTITYTIAPSVFSKPY